MAFTDTILINRAALLAKIETTEGVDASPAATDAVLVEVADSPISIDAERIQPNEAQASLDRSESIVGGMKVSLTCSVLLRGTDTPGVAPAWGTLLKACGFDELVTATGVPAAAELLTAGSATSATLGAGAAATANLYRGMPISFAKSGDPDRLSFISGYTAAKAATLTDTFASVLDPTFDYRILPNVRYVGTSDKSKIKTLTLYWYEDGTLYKIVGARGTVDFAIPTGGIGKINFKFSGIAGSPVRADAALPSIDFGVSFDPPRFRAGAFTIDRRPASLKNLTFNTNTQLAQPGDPNAAEGFGSPFPTERRWEGQIDPNETLAATRDILGDFRGGAKRLIHARYGETPGNRFAFTVPNAKYVTYGQAVDEKARTASTTFECTGADDAAVQFTVF